jgi:adenosyl cobinamide kinase/adenosyl cobinamide phosphate guanylyltransferase
MPLILLLGGARSGKSDLAVRLAARQHAGVVMIATGEAGDAEMAERIARHRRERPLTWTTIESPRQVEEAIANAPDDACMIIDCLTLWIANLLAVTIAAEIEELAASAARRAAARRGTTIVVSNEVGLGIVPDNPPARAYRDLLGRVNASWAAAADRAYLLVAGRVLALGTVDAVLAEPA